MYKQFAPVTIEQISAAILNRISIFPSIIDGFLVDHIYDSAHYSVIINNKEAGYFSIHNGSLMTQFYLAPEWSSLSQQIFAEVKKMAQVQAAFVPTCDEYFLSHALDEYRHIEKQAYFFNYDSSKACIDIDSRFHCYLAKITELDFIKEKSGNFFSEDELPTMLQKNQVWLSYYDDVWVGIGLIIRSKLFPDVADLGMYTINTHRQKGYGRLTIHYLINECLSKNLRIAAGCWYYNHNSKKTLESAGMHVSTRLLKVNF